MANQPANTNSQQEWVFSFLLVLPWIPIASSLLHVLGFKLSDEVWAAHALIGIGVLLFAGTLCLWFASEMWARTWLGIAFLIGGLVLLLVWQNPSTEAFAYMASGVISFLALIVVRMLTEKE